MVSWCNSIVAKRAVEGNLPTDTSRRVFDRHELEILFELGTRLKRQLARGEAPVTVA